MSDILTVAQSTFGRYARLLPMYLILMICVIDVALMGLYHEFSMGMDQSLMTDCALAILTLVAALSAVTVAFDVPRELREKTAVYILTRPGGRSSFIWGKFLGISGLVLFNTGIVLAASWIVVYLNYHVWDIKMLAAGILVILQGVVLAGVALVFATFLDDVLAAILTFVLFFVAHALFMLFRMAEPFSFLGYILPNFHTLDLKTEVAASVGFEQELLLYGIGYGIGYAVFMVGIATLLFSRKDIS
jgi:ABC-type transport system involved in multi-copper enzyme maturation permease subunit